MATIEPKEYILKKGHSFVLISRRTEQYVAVELQRLTNRIGPTSSYRIAREFDTDTTKLDREIMRLQA